MSWNGLPAPGARNFQFLLLTDPQQGEVEGRAADVRSNACSKVNVSLNNLYTQNFPPPGKTPTGGDIDITITGRIPQDGGSVFFAGDLTEYGGLQNNSEQSLLIGDKNSPWGYLGGEQLQDHHALYDPMFSKSNLTKLDPKKCGKLHFGLGNHDMVDGKGSGWKYKPADYSTGDNYYRYQMWNYIVQMHIGYPGKTNAPFKIQPTDIDAPPPNAGGWRNEWKNYSFNYYVDMGPVDVYQVHRFLGDGFKGRKSGLNWLKHKLVMSGYTKPVIIIQHFDLGAHSLAQPGTKPVWPSWSAEDRAHLYEILMPFNVIAICTGHWHDQPTVAEDGGVPSTYVYPNAMNPPTLPPEPSPFRVKWLSEIRPGAVFNGYFSLVHGEPLGGNKGIRLNVLYGTVGSSQKPGEVYWQWGWNRVFTPPPVLYIRGIEVVALDQDGENSHRLPMLCTEMSGQSPDINKGHGGKYVYIRPLLTPNPKDAISGLAVDFTGGESGKGFGMSPNIAEGSSDGRPIWLRTLYGGSPMTGLFVLRSPTPSSYAAAPQMAGMTGNINEKRGGDYLYLIWRIWQG